MTSSMSLSGVCNHLLMLFSQYDGINLVEVAGTVLFNFLECFHVLRSVFRVFGRYQKQITPAYCNR